MKTKTTTRVSSRFLSLLVILSFAKVAAASVIIGGTPPTRAPSPGERYGAIGQDLFEYSRTDFNLAGPIPIVMKRVYRSGDVDSSGNSSACSPISAKASSMS